MKDAPTVGIIGLGIGRAHIRAFLANGCRVVGLCQRDEAAVRKVAAQYGIDGVFTRWQDLIERARPDIVVIATPPRLHRDIALAAFAAGAHVLCEKPLAMNRDEAREMVDAAARHRRVAMTCFNWRFTVAMQEMHRRLTGGFVGRVFHVSGRWLAGFAADEKAPVTWRMDREQAGHGAMGDMGVHLVDLVRWNVGEIASVCAHMGVAYPNRSADDHCSLVARLTSGALVSLRHKPSRAWHERARTSGVRVARRACLPPAAGDAAMVQGGAARRGGERDARAGGNRRATRSGRDGGSHGSDGEHSDGAARRATPRSDPNRCGAVLVVRGRVARTGGSGCRGRVGAA